MEHKIRTSWLLRGQDKSSGLKPQYWNLQIGTVIACLAVVWDNVAFKQTLCSRSYYAVPDRSGDGVLFSIDFFVYIFVSLLARLRENGWTDFHEIFREGMEWPWDDLITFWLLSVISEKPRDAAMCNTETGFVVLLHHSLFNMKWWLSTKFKMAAWRRFALSDSFLISVSFRATSGFGRELALMCFYIRNHLLIFQALMCKI